MSRTTSTTKIADSKGRITLGPAFANKTVLIEKQDDGVRVRIGRFIPENETWLYENEAALKSVRQGLKQAQDRKFAQQPDLDAAKELSDRIQDN
ncbi:MAG: hypothetical protein JKY43_00770 [Phycisphaerales bacterium]|nr:hypothetical protein [Phycisphaerales bacterium]